MVDERNREEKKKKKKAEKRRDKQNKRKKTRENDTIEESNNINVLISENGDDDDNDDEDIKGESNRIQHLFHVFETDITCLVIFENELLSFSPHYNVRILDYIKSNVFQIKQHAVLMDM